MTHKTDILDLVARKLAPYMLLFGLYLVSYGDSSPGGGFQGGVVIASGVILLAMARDVATAERLFPPVLLASAETAAYAVFLIAGIVGMAAGAGFLADVFGRGADAAVIPAARFVFVLNLAIGIKVAAGVSLICLHLFRED